MTSALFDFTLGDQVVATQGASTVYGVAKAMEVYETNLYGQPTSLQVTIGRSMSHSGIEFLTPDWTINKLTEENQAPE